MQWKAFENITHRCLNLAWEVSQYFIILCWMLQWRTIRRCQGKFKSFIWNPGEEARIKISVFVSWHCLSGSFSSLKQHSILQYNLSAVDLICFPDSLLTETRGKKFYVTFRKVDWWLITWMGDEGGRGNSFLWDEVRTPHYAFAFSLHRSHPFISLTHDSLHMRWSSL